MRKLSSLEMQAIVNGSSWYGTGGGFPLTKQLADIKPISPQLCSVNELEENSLVCCAYGLGSAAHTDISLRASFLEAIAILERKVGYRCRAIFPAEVNIESAIFEVATNLGLPVLDADTCGGRAVPELKYDNFTLLQRSVAPIVAVNAQLESLVIESYCDIDAVEQELRAFAVRSPGSALAVVDHPITVAHARTALSLGTLSRSLRLGKALQRYRDGELSLPELLNKESARIVFEGGRVVESAVKDRNGFFQGIMKVKSGEALFLIEVQNELMRVRCDDALLGGFPDLLVPVDPQSMLGLHSTQCVVGRAMTLLFIHASELWRQNYNVPGLSMI